MKNKKIKYKDLCQMVQEQKEQKDQIQELKQTINYIQNNYSYNVPFQAEIAYAYSPYTAEELHISYLKDGKVNTITYTLKSGFLSFPKIKEIGKQNSVTYIITIQRAKDYYEYYAVDTSNWTIFDATPFIKSNDDKLTTAVKTQNIIN